MDNIMLSLLFFSMLILIHYLDKWSTRILLNYKKICVNNEAIRNKKQEIDLREGTERYEINRIVRYFMKRFGIKKGFFLTDLFIIMPIFLIITILYIFGLVPFLTLYGMVYFYIGALFTQILRAYFVATRECKKLEIDYKTLYNYNELKKGS